VTPSLPQEQTAAEFGASYPQLNQNLIGDLAGQGVSFVVDSDIGYQRSLSQRRLRPQINIGPIPGRYDPVSRTLRVNPGASLGTVAHEILHAATGLAPQYIDTALMTRSNRLAFQQTGRAYRAIPEPGQSASFGNLVQLSLAGARFELAGGAEQITGEGERIAHSLAGSTPANPYPINAFRNIFNRGVIPYNLMPRIQSGVRK